MMPSAVAAQITAELSIPTIGIGAGPGTDGQILVWTDFAGLSGGRVPKFVRQYADLRGTLLAAAKAYKADVEAGAYPAAEHEFHGLATDDLHRYAGVDLGPRPVARHRPSFRAPSRVRGMRGRRATGRALGSERGALPRRAPAPDRTARCRRRGPRSRSSISPTGTPFAMSFSATSV